MKMSVVAYQVVRPSKTENKKVGPGVERITPISRRFHVRQAAEEFARLARLNGIEGAYVREVVGEDIRQ